MVQADLFEVTDTASAGGKRREQISVRIGGVVKSWRGSLSMTKYE